MVNQRLWRSKFMNLICLLEKQESVEGLKHFISTWVNIIPKIQEIRLFCFPDDLDFSSEDWNFSLNEPQVLINSGKLPPFINSRVEWAQGAIYYPLRQHHGLPLGILLFRSNCPQIVLKKFKTFLAVILSKLSDKLLLIQYEHQNAIYSKLQINEYQMIQSVFPTYVLDREGKFLFINGAFTKVFGYSTPKDLQNRTFFDLEARNKELQSLKFQATLDGFEISALHASGRQMTLLDFLRKENQFTWGVVIDISEYVSRSEEFQQALRIQEFLNNEILHSALILEKTQSTSIRALARLAEYRDHETGSHLQRICEYTKVLGKELLKLQPFDSKISENYIKNLVLSSMLHDIGKVGVPDSILRKKGRFSHEERELMKKHTLWGWEILNTAVQEFEEESYLTLASQIALSHHEYWNGEGYPRGLKAENIPLSARISAIADVYDALTSVRPYKEAWSHEKAVAEILSQKGQQFDPVLVEVFLEVQDEFRAISSLYTTQESKV